MSVGDTLTRKELICKQDIKHQYNIDGIERHKDDQLSVCAWVNELQSMDNNSVIAFKPQGNESLGER